MRSLERFRNALVNALGTHDKPIIPEAIQNGEGIRFPTSNWQPLRPDIQSGPLKDAIVGSGGESLFNAVSDGKVQTGDPLQIRIIKNNENSTATYYYIKPSHPLFPPMVPNMHRPHHWLYSPENEEVIETGAILTWIKFPNQATSVKELGKAAEKIREFLDKNPSSQ